MDVEKFVEKIKQQIEEFAKEIIRLMEENKRFKIRKNSKSN